VLKSQVAGYRAQGTIRIEDGSWKMEAKTVTGFRLQGSRSENGNRKSSQGAGHKLQGTFSANHSAGLILTLFA
jgi:hypothetical protein